MKKFLLSFMAFIILTGCGNMQVGNTPSKKVEAYFNKYQTLDKAVLEDLDTTLLSDTSISGEEREAYRNFMKKHYQDLTYEIKNETIDGDNAVVDVEITVKDYSDAISNADANKAQFEDGSITTFSNYRLEELKKVKDKVTYTLSLNLVKEDDTWVLQQLSNEDLNKINGLYAG